MKKTLSIIIALLTAGLMLMAFAACDESKSLFSISPRTSGLHLFRHILPEIQAKRMFR
jgi:hypothetical protein